MKYSIVYNIGDFTKGNKKAFEEIYNLYHKRLYYFATRLTGDPEEAKDIISETFLKLWKLRERFETYNNIQAFLYITTRNACMDYLRKARRVAGESIDYSYTFSAVDDSAFEREMIEAEVLQMIYEEIENLPEQCRKVIKLFYKNNLKNEDIAQQLQIQLQTVKNHKTRGLNMLRRAIAIWRRKKAGK